MGHTYCCTAPWEDTEIEIVWRYEPGDASCGQAGGAVVERVYDTDPRLEWCPARIARNNDELEALALACTDEPEVDADLAADLRREG